MGIDGPDTGPRGNFCKVRALINALTSSTQSAQSMQFLASFLTEIERAVLNFCHERIPDIDMPSQKLVFLTKAS